MLTALQLGRTQLQWPLILGDWAYRWWYVPDPVASHIAITYNESDHVDNVFQARDSTPSSHDCLWLAFAGIPLLSPRLVNRGTFV